MSSSYRVLGAGVWGLAFSDYLSKLGHNVQVFCRDTNLSNKKLTGLDLPSLSKMEIKSLDTLDNLKSSDAINIIAVNSKGFDGLLGKHASYFHGVRELVSLTKGIDHETGSFFHEIVKERFGNDVAYGLISGPSFAKDLSNRKKMSVSFASSNNYLSSIIVESTKSSYFEMIPTTKIYHIEIAGIIKNIAAILCGMADSFFDKGKYTNSIIKKACDETWKMSFEVLNKKGYTSEDGRNLIDHLNDNKEEIITSPGFIGDMILTCKQDQSRNYQFGNLIADLDISIEKAKNNIGTVEGYDCCITLVEKSPYMQGDLTNLLYEIIKSENMERKKLLKEFLQA